MFPAGEQDLHGCPGIQNCLLESDLPIVGNQADDMYQHGGRDIAHLMSVGQRRRIRPQHIRSQGMARSKV